jgi:uncharacterized protein (DUF2062 family)
MLRSFLLGTIFGILITSLLSFASHMLWNYALPEQWRDVMSPLVFSIIQAGILVFFSAIVLVVYFWLERRKKTSEDKADETRTSQIITAINTGNENIIRAIQNQKGGDKNGNSTTSK